MHETSQDTTPKTLPFNNLFLNSGLVHGINHWSIYLLTISLTLFCYFLSPAITFLHLFFMARQNGISDQTLISNMPIILDSKATGIDLNFILLALFGIFVITFAGFWFAIKKFHKKTFVSIVTGYEKFRFNRFWFAFLVWSLLIAVTVIIDYYSNPESFKLVLNYKGFLISLLLMIVFMPIQAGWEEVFFRGYLIQGFSLIFRNGLIPLIITSLLFGLAHMFNPEVDKFGWPIMLTYYFSFGLFMGGLTLLDEGLELAFGIHLANNLITGALISSPDSVLQTYSVFETKSEDPKTEIVVWVCMAFITFLIFWFRYRWKNFSLIIK
jgi:membrane protease YdiL (CAAX protease family)